MIVFVFFFLSHLENIMGPGQMSSSRFRDLESSLYEKMALELLMEHSGWEDRHVWHSALGRVPQNIKPT